MSDLSFKVVMAQRVEVLRDQIYGLNYAIRMSTTRMYVDQIQYQLDELQQLLDDVREQEGLNDA